MPVERELTLLERIAIAEEFLQGSELKYIVYFYTGGFPLWKQLGDPLLSYGEASVHRNDDMKKTGNMIEMYRIIERYHSTTIMPN